jgi:hypothetical protein
MERCSNCGAAVRPGAKFCTSCGTRLNLDQASTQPAAASWTQPADDETEVSTPAVTPEEEPSGQVEERAGTTAATDTDAAGSVVTDDTGDDTASSSSWRWGSSTSEQPASAPDASEAATEAKAAPEPSRESDGATWSWGQQPQSTQPADEPEPATTDEEATTVEGTEDAPRDTAWTSRWPSMADDTDTASPPEATAETAPAEESPANRLADALDEEAATEQDTGEQLESRETAEEASSAGTAETPASTENALAASTSGWSWGQTRVDEEEVATESETIVPTTADASAGLSDASDVEEGESITAVDSTALAEEAQAPETATDDNARQRATALLDELRALLPQIGGAGVASTIADTGERGSNVADELSHARDEAGEFSSLRRTLESARDNPRDVDTMLDLVNRADRLLALLDSHDALAGAVDDAITKLRNS